ncbi:hypothetical protein C480_20304 [Natrialba aegyptia DSM 13077]|uniref:CAAX prenyl protease 2/Lysostaphin resistance protein A-like domain-containing protein n=2 Tax=Natrialba aegyptia TaxID=129789 RepID=M0ANX7_9EURY|nr:hypothetical protein C480_20304 [Natrialba aegyptia DSM 13077]
MFNRIMDNRQQADELSGSPLQTGWRSRVRALVIGLGLVVTALLIGTALSIPLFVLGGTSLAALTATIILSEAGYAIAGWLYLRRWFSESVPITLPTPRQGVWVIASTLLMLGIATGVSALSTMFDVQFGRVDQEFIAGNPTMVLVMAALSFVLIAPAEEYLFRGVIQQRLMRSMQPSAAIVATAFLFVIPHAIGYLGGAEGVFLLSVVPFSLAVVMGVLYERVNNLSVPILAHACYNAALFLTTYVTEF